MAIDLGIYFGNVVMTILTVLVFFVLMLAFLYVIWGREEAAHASQAQSQVYLKIFLRAYLPGIS